MRIYLLRHAETNSNVAKIIQGSLDTDLNEHGHAQASALAVRLQDVVPDRIFCSDLKRCKQTLGHVLAERPNPISSSSVIYTEALRERYMAELQGVSKEEVDRMCAERGVTKFEFGEGTAALTSRVENFWRTCIEPLYAKTEIKVIFVCSHGGTLLRLAQSLHKNFGFDTSEDVPIGSLGRASGNTGITILRVSAEDKIFEQYADTAHLREMSKEEQAKDEDREVVDA
ncbi:hypothetical protein PYCC9005_000368 [Savitreella phatthalungensis]